MGDTGHFMWVDTYPSLEVWAAVQTAWASSEEAAAIEEEPEAKEPEKLTSADKTSTAPLDKEEKATATRPTDV